MRGIGLLGGMSWESSIEYYRFVNEAARATGSASCIRPTASCVTTRLHAERAVDLALAETYSSRTGFTAG
jgi:hypothetical protein